MVTALGFGFRSLQVEQKAGYSGISVTAVLDRWASARWTLSLSLRRVSEPEARAGCC